MYSIQVDYLPGATYSRLILDKTISNDLVEKLVIIQPGDFIDCGYVLIQGPRHVHAFLVQLDTRRYIPKKNMIQKFKNELFNAV